jgi:hypothetical protein
MPLLQHDGNVAPTIGDLAGLLRLLRLLQT